MIGPGAAPMLQQRRCIPFADLAAEPVAIDLAQAQHDMGVGFGLAIGTDIPMDVEVGDHAAVDNFARDELARERDALLLRHLARDRELDLPCKLRILAPFARPDFPPQPLAIRSPLAPTCSAPARAYPTPPL